MPINLDLSPRLERSQLDSLFSLANGKTTLAGTPYTIAPPSFTDWQFGTSYSSGVWVFWQGAFYYSLSGSNTAPPSDSTYWKATNSRGAYNGATAYAANDSVTSGGYTWISTTSQTGNPPLTGATPPVPNSGWFQPYLAAYNRMRVNLMTGATGKPAASRLVSATTVSGKWPISAVTATTLSGNYGLVSIVFPDSGTSETLSLTSSNSCFTSKFATNEFKKASIKVIIGGNVPVTFTGAFSIGVLGSGSASGTSPDPITAFVDIENTFPGMTWTAKPLSDGAVWYCEVNGVSINPGVYTVAVRMTGSTYQINPSVYATNCGFGTIGTPGQTIYSSTLSLGQIVVSKNYVPGTNGVGTASIACSFSTQSDFNGIHNSKQIKYIGSTDDNNRVGFGLFVTGKTNGTNEDSTESTPTNSWTSTEAGAFYATSSPIRSLEMLLHDSMPWNLFKLPSGSTPSTSDAPPQALSQPYQVGTSAPYNYTRAYSTPWEKQNTNPAWVASTWFPAGFIIRDSNGNLQQSGGGKSGSSAPTWATTGATTDNTVTWTFLSSPSASISAGRARMFSIPNYPVIWDSDSWTANTAVLLGQQIRDSNGEIRVCSQAGTTGGSTPTWGSGGSASIASPNWGMEGSAAEITDGTAKWRPYMAGFNPRGWWIYRLNINRISTPNNTNTSSGSGSTGAGAGSAGGGGQNVSVEVGIYRSGSFVSFGTYQTGASVSAMWPIFTNTPLVYRCAERVDVQASIINCGNSFNVNGSVSTYPICAAYYNDIEKILNLIS